MEDQNQSQESGAPEQQGEELQSVGAEDLPQPEAEGGEQEAPQEAEGGEQEAPQEDEAPARRYAEDVSTAPPTAPVPPRFPANGDGFRRPEGELPPAVRSAQRVKSRDPRAKARARRAAQGE